MRRFLLFFLVLLVSIQFAGCRNVQELNSDRGNRGSFGGEPDSRNPESQIKVGYVPEIPAHTGFVSATELAEILAKGQANRTDGVDGQIESEQVEKGEYGKIIAGVVPHHLVPGALLVEIMRHIAAQEPELLVLVGPNHHNLGGKIITGFANWQTPTGIVQTDRKTVQYLLEQKIAVCDEAVLEKEHAIGNLAPLIKYFLPQAKIVPLILHHDVGLAEVDELVAVLEPVVAEGKAILLSSVDFSHYLTAEEAKKKDRVTLKVMRNRDYPLLFRLDNDYLDSPASLALAFRFAKRKGGGEFRLLGNTNSGEIFRDNNMETTSYFTLLFTKQS